MKTKSLLVQLRPRAFTWWRALSIFGPLLDEFVQWMADRALTFANGPSLAAKHSRPGRAVVETRTTTIDDGDIASRADTCTTARVRAVVVSRIDPRKGLRVLPAVVRQVLDAGVDLSLDVIGPAVGAPGEDERRAIAAASSQYGVADRVSLVGAVPLEQLLPMYARYDLFVLPTLPGEGIPRVLLEAMSAGLPVVTTRTAGIPGLVQHELNGLLVDEPSSDAIARAVLTIVRDATLRRRLIANGYDTARAHTLRGQAARMASTLTRELRLPLRAATVAAR